MLNVVGRGTVFELKDKDTYIVANLSSSKKQTDDTYINMYWKVKFVGKSKEKAREIKLKDKDRIEIKEGIIENNYNKEKEKLWVNVTIFDFEII